MSELRNLLLNPRPGVPGSNEFAVVFAGEAEISYVNDRITVKATKTNGHASAARGIDLSAGDWVFSTFMGPYSGSDTCTTFSGRGVYAIANNAFIAHAPFDGTNKRYTIQFHLDAPTTVQLRLTGPTTVGQSLEYCHSILASKQDYDELRALTDANGEPLNLTWFDGNTYPRSGGGLSLLAVYPHHLALEVVA